MAKYKCRKDCFDGIFYCKGEIYDFADNKKVSEHFERIPEVKEMNEESEKAKTEKKTAKNVAKKAETKNSKKKFDETEKKAEKASVPVSEIGGKEEDAKAGKE